VTRRLELLGCAGLKLLSSADAVLRDLAAFEVAYSLQPPAA